MSNEALIDRSIFDRLTKHANTVVVDKGGNGCGLNSLAGCEIMRDEFGLTPYEIILERRDGRTKLKFAPQSPDENGFGPDANFSWEFHVVPARKVGDTYVVYDPLLFDGPVSLKEYLGCFPKDIQHEIRDSSVMTYIEATDVGEYSSSGQYFRSMNFDHYLKKHPDIGIGSAEFRASCDEILSTRCGPTLGEFASSLLRRTPQHGLS